MSNRKSKLLRCLLYFLGGLIILVAILILLYKDEAISQISVGSGFVAKKACTYHFMAGRDLDEISSTEFNISPLNLISTKVSGEDRVTASIFGLGTNTAVYKKNLGCVLIHGVDDYNIELSRSSDSLTESTPLPVSKSMSPSDPNLKEAVRLAMDKDGEWLKQTTGLMVIHKDSIVLEGYAAGYNSETEILGWSMTKSISALLIGTLIRDRKLSLEQDNLFPEWAADERQNIRLKHLLNMTSGLEWTEEYEEVCDVTQGLFKEENFLSFVRGKKSESKPGTVWEYSSGTTNLISGIIRQELDDLSSYLSYPNKALFTKLGIADAHIEIDEAGNMIMSSFGYAKMRDWAKLGMLYMHKGHWNGEQLIDSSFIDYCISPTVESDYGGQIWLNTSQSEYPSAPSNMYYFSGYDGQYVFMFPSQDLMILRTGVQKEAPFDMDAVIAQVLKSIN